MTRQLKGIFKAQLPEVLSLQLNGSRNSTPDIAESHISVTYLFRNIDQAIFIDINEDQRRRRSRRDDLPLG
jgi:hypothetical protein